MDTHYFNDKATVLVVDDTPDNLSLMSALLKNSYKVKVANHGDKALRIATSATPPELILLDVMMPDIDGYEVCRRLKANPRTRDKSADGVAVLLFGRSLLLGQLTLDHRQSDIFRHDELHDDLFANGLDFSTFEQ